MDRSERTIKRKEARRRRSVYGEREKEVEKGREKVSREEERRAKSKTSGERERQKEGGKGMRREKEDEVGCVWKGGGEESGKAPNVGDARVRDATSESVKGIILKKVGW